MCNTQRGLEGGSQRCAVHSRRGRRAGRALPHAVFCGLGLVPARREAEGHAVFLSDESRRFEVGVACWGGWGRIRRGDFVLVGSG